MPNNHDERMKELLERFDQLPEKMQRAFIWLIENYKDIEEMCKGGPLSPEMREQFTERALRNDDTYMLVLLAAEKVFNAPQETPEEEVK